MSWGSGAAVSYLGDVEISGVVKKWRKKLGMRVQRHCAREITVRDGFILEDGVSL